MKGVTSSGFEFEVDNEVLDDYEILEDLAAMENGEPQKIVTILPALLGEEQFCNLKEFLRKDNGRVKATDMTKALSDIFVALKENSETKNS
jgi:hypothetical protein